MHYKPYHFIHCRTFQVNSSLDNLQCLASMVAFSIVLTTWINQKLLNILHIFIKAINHYNVHSYVYQGPYIAEKFGRLRIGDLSSSSSDASITTDITTFYNSCPSFIALVVTIYYNQPHDCGLQRIFKLGCITPSAVCLSVHSYRWL